MVSFVKTAGRGIGDSEKCLDGEDQGSAGRETGHNDHDYDDDFDSDEDDDDDSDEDDDGDYDHDYGDSDDDDCTGGA